MLYGTGEFRSEMLKEAVVVNTIGSMICSTLSVAVAQRLSNSLVAVIATMVLYTVPPIGPQEFAA